MAPPLCQTELGDGPLVACAIHNGHATRPEVAALLKLDAAARRYEEDPYTGEWTAIAPTHIIGLRSRFEFDLNRPREKAIYLTPADCWGLDVWKSPPPADVVDRSLSLYDDFYAHLRLLLERLVARHGRVVVFDLHSYNHVRGRRGGEAGEQENPEINLGTATMDRDFWSPIVDRWLAEMRSYDYLGRSLDVRENVKFFGGHFPNWIHQNFPNTVCALAIEVKKIFMDEWTGQLDTEKHQAIGQALAQAAGGVRAELETWQHGPPSAKQDGQSLAAAAIAQLAKDKRVRMELPGGGWLQLDRRLPFLCVYRRRTADEDPGTEQLVTSEMAYIVIPADGRPAAQALQLLRAMVEQLAKHFGAFLLVEIWSAPLTLRHEPAASANGSTANVAPRFEVVAPTARIPRRTVEALSKSLGKNTLPLGSAWVTLAPPERLAPGGMKPLVKMSDLKAWNCSFLGVKVRPVYRDPVTLELFPVELRAIRRSVNNAFKQAFFAFTRQRTALRLAHYQALGGRSVVKAVLDIDRQLADIGRSFDLLLQATPINAETAWREFRRSRFEKPPVFYYRPLAIDPTLLKRQLYLIPVERIDDPTLSYLFRQKQEELDRQITLLTDVDTPRFLPESLQIYGGVSDTLLAQAKQLLDRVPTRSREEASDGQLTATEFAKRAQQELGYYQQQCADFAATVAVRDDMYAGMMVSRNQLLIGGKTRVPKRRVDALLQHEIGTHLITRYNGHVQPFQQLEVGLAGYDGLQEGLAVLAEYLVGGLSRFRIRVLAARVVAGQHLLDGASFIETFRALDRNYEFSQRTAYTVTMRIFRGGGLTKDAIYLRGLLQILKYLRGGGELEPLYVGKIAAAHLPLLAELSLRQIIKPPALRPRYLEGAKSLKKIEELRRGMTVLELLKT